MSQTLKTDGSHSRKTLGTRKKQSCRPQVSKTVNRKICLAKSNLDRIPQRTDFTTISKEKKTVLILDWKYITRSAERTGHKLSTETLIRFLRAAIFDVKAIVTLSEFEPERSRIKNLLEYEGYSVVAELSRQHSKEGIEALIGIVTGKAVFATEIEQLILCSGAANFAPMIRFIRRSRSTPLKVVVFGVAGAITQNISRVADGVVLLGEDILFPKIPSPFSFLKS